MNLYIRIENSFPVNHPATEENLLDAFGEIPSDWEPFERVDDPTRTNNKLMLLHPMPLYIKVDGVWKDDWQYREKTPEEIEQMFKPYKDAWNANPYVHNFSAWIFNENTGTYEPPFPRPADHGYQGKFYRWCGAENNWKLAPLIPKDGKNYYFDFDNWTNVEIVSE